jgi:hypothetical protein
MSMQETQKATRPMSSRKIEANRRNAQHSTGPKTPEGKAKSSQNSTTHGIFVKRFLNGAAPEIVAEIEVLAAGIREYYQPVGMLEEILVQKIVIETARYDRVLGFEQKFEQFTSGPIHLVACLEHAVRYTTSTSRALFRAIEELERIQAARKGRESSAVSKAAEPALPTPQTKEEQPASQVVSTALSKRSTPDDPEDAAGKAVAA